MQIKRRKTKIVKIGSLLIGGRNNIAIQSMANTDTRDIRRTVKQIKELERAGCEIVRVAVLDEEAARAIGKIKKDIDIPLVADIHFNYKLALMSIHSGADKIRINPGNITSKKQLREIVKLASAYGIPIRIGINSGSVKRSGRENLVEDMITCAKRQLDIFKTLNFDQVVFSLKAPDVMSAIAAYRRMTNLTDAPMHLGITAAGRAECAIVKSSLGIGVLLLEGIGDTIRVSLTGDPADEVRIAKEILKTLNIRRRGFEIISCPTCGRCNIDLVDIVKKVEQGLSKLDENKFGENKIKIAVMGCVVNGPGEAKDADVGIAWAQTRGVLFKKGKRIRVLRKGELINALLAEVIK
ncbi:MAG: flavodoxin-dependent (E)-4-hydroxy-3-methylbut-2-enyl-diphosphate synthase [Candidatus Omnitrophica bacterium]|nr:flavodoxin-dependent (E)-4-hydroxy-3-methylbut-2-enyl-diphosphate synthase [Candidatus Omnitrophota bacterium]MBU1924950.1 flavodoxin-dependent (E)-4-hydroxy-3-methylbut-2-enyl-diphosphate synthase [Candidatus Omnitrophota bacterium]